MSLLEFRARLHYPTGFLLDAAFESDARVTALFGPSGSGKSTILSIIAGLRKPDTAYIRLGETVLFDDRRAINLPPESRRVGYVFQQHLLFPHLGVRDNLLYGWQRRPATSRKIDPERVTRALDLDHLLDRKPATLSVGQRQRVALGRALLCAPELLLFDEPLASVDEEMKQQILVYTRKVLEEWEIPTLYVSHDAAEVQQICSAVLRVSHGRVEPSPIEEAGRQEVRPPAS